MGIRRNSFVPLELIWGTQRDWACKLLRSCVGPGMLTQLTVLLQELGGAKYIFLTHRDDVAAHYKWASALGAERIMHTMETTEKQRTE